MTSSYSQEKTGPAASGANAGPSRPGKAVDLEKVLRSAGQLAYRWDIANDRIDWAGEVENILGIGDRSAIATAKAYSLSIDAQTAPQRYDTAVSHGKVDAGAGVPYRVKYRFMPDGRRGERAVWVEEAGRCYAGADGRPSYTEGVIRAIDAQHEQERKLTFRSNYDELTGLMNRARLSDVLGEALSQCERHKTSCGFLLAAVDNLALVNDAYGFDVADQVIAAVGHRMKEHLRAGDSLGRHSGNKFGILMLNCGQSDMLTAAGRLLQSVRDQVIETSSGPVSVTISVGGVLLPRFATSVHQTMAYAQEALDAAKLKHDDCFVSYERNEQRENRRRHNIAIADEIVAALNEGRMLMAYQPIVKNKSRQPDFYECLLRMRKPDGTVVCADKFIPIAEQLGLSRLIDHRVAEIAVKTLDANPGLRLSMNISGRTANDPAWLGHLTALLKAHRGASNRLIVEITETVAIQDIEDSSRFVHALHELGCQIAIDDFGAGYTSFRNLKMLDVDMVKIDGSFVKDLVSCPDDRFFVQTLVELARNFNVTTVAEWVEDEETAELLAQWGIDYFQGHLFGAAELEPPWITSAPQDGALSGMGSQPDAITMNAD